MIGFKILERQRVIDPQIAAAFNGVPVSLISDSMSRMFAAGPNLRPMHNGRYMAGAALTVKTLPGDNLMIHKAIDMAVKGDVIVVDAGGDLTNALIGEIMTSLAASKGVVGMVINGSVRDSDFLSTQDFGVYAAGVTHRGPYKDGPGEINVPISFGGMIVSPGDLVVGDADGVLCVPIDQAQELLSASLKKREQEEQMLKAIHAGTYEPHWLHAALEAKIGPRK